MSTTKTKIGRSRPRTGIWTMAWRNIGRRPRRSVLSALAIGIAALCMVVLLALIAGLKHDTEQTVKQNFTADILIQHKDYQRSGSQHANQVIIGLNDLIARLQGISNQSAGIQSLSARITGAASVFVDGEAVFFPYIGMQSGQDPIGLTGLLLPGGRIPEPGARQAVISQVLADRLKLKIGDSLTAITQTQRGSSNGITFTITGLLSPSANQFSGPFMFIDLATAQRFVHLADGATSLLVKLGPQANAQTILAAIRQELPTDGELVAEPWNRTSTTYGLLAMGDIMYNFIGLFFFILASTVMINTMLMVVLERSREIGTLAALGMDRSVIRRLFLAESAVLGSLGAGVGCLLGCVISLVMGSIGFDFSAAMQGMNLEMSSIIRPKLELQNPLIVFAMAVLVSTAFTFLPVRRIYGMSIVNSLRGD